MKKNQGTEPENKALYRLQQFEQAREIPNAPQTAKKKVPKNGSKPSSLTKKQKNVKPNQRDG
jgi:hypothetical protein